MRAHYARMVDAARPWSWAIADRVAFLLESLSVSIALFIALTWAMLGFDWQTTAHEWGSFWAHYAKASAEARRAWARILAALPTARLVVLAPPAQAESIRAGFVADGARAEQVEVIEELALDGWLALMEDVDIALDSFPYRGGTTAMMSDWRGVPLVALLPEGQGKDDDRRLYCRDEDEYVATAVALAGDLDQLVERRAELPLIARLDEAANADLAIRALERLFREIWATYLERRSRA